MGSQDTACPLKVGVGPKTKKRAGKKVKCLTSMLKLHCVARNSQYIYIYNQFQSFPKNQSVILADSVEIILS